MPGAGEGGTLEVDGVQAAALWLMASFSQASLSTCLVNVVASWKMLKVKPTYSRTRATQRVARVLAEKIRAVKPQPVLLGFKRP